MNLIKTEIDWHADTIQNGTALAFHCTALFAEKRFSMIFLIFHPLAVREICGRGDWGGYYVSPQI
jgi:hypothetical protein